MRKIGLPAIMGVLLLLFSQSCSEKIEPGTTPKNPGPAVAAPVMEIHQADQPIVYEAVGTVKAKLSATVSSKLMGVIQRFNVKEGDQVKKEDLLVVLDDRQVVAQLDQALAALAAAQKAETGAISARSAAEAGAQQARLSYARNKKMLAGGAITQEAFEAVDAQYKQAQASLAQAEAMVEAARSRVSQARAAVESAQVARKDAEVLAPFDGEVTAKMADAGALAAPGTPLLTLEREGGYRVDVVVPETYIRAVHTGQAVKVRIPAIQALDIDGTVDVIVPAGDQGSRTFVVQVGVPSMEALRSGMFARVPLTIGQQQMLRIPSSAVVRQGQLTGVFIVDDKNIAHFRLIRTGRQFTDQVEVISGITDGTRLVTAPPVQLTNGSAVEFAK
ncbi:efflux transporter, RND family, MFP subunit, related to HlyD [Desulfosarcina variabilis str. Montpellier]|uniref:efflux RND transporter periplasmic adaptor subunit n=1 Tax=Desulfosarcina variabilis TaxID=2300 RepID=UPI003AFA86B1